MTSSLEREIAGSRYVPLRCRECGCSAAALVSAHAHAHGHGHDAANVEGVVQYFCPGGCAVERGAVEQVLGLR